MTTIIIAVVAAVILFKLFSKSVTNYEAREAEREQEEMINEDFDFDDEEKEHKANNKGLYKHCGIKSFDIAGLYYRNLSIENDTGFFHGLVKCENNSRDRFAIAIYNDKGKHVGFIPKGHRVLNNSLNKWHRGEVFAWGDITYMDYCDKWRGCVYVPVGLNDDRIYKIKEIIDLVNKRNHILSKEAIISDEYFKILEDNEKIISNATYIGDDESLPGIEYELPKRIIHSLAMKLESEKRWKALVKLEEHEELINNLSEKFKNSTYNRIEKAKNKLKIHA